MTRPSPGVAGEGDGDDTIEEGRRPQRAGTRQSHICLTTSVVSAMAAAAEGTTTACLRTDDDAAGISHKMTSYLTASLLELGRYHNFLGTL